MAGIIDGMAELYMGKLENKNIHIQLVEFKILQSVFNKLTSAWRRMNEDIFNTHPHDTLISLLDLIKEFLSKSIISDLNGNDLINLMFYHADKIATHMLKMLDEKETEKLKPYVYNYGHTGNRKSRFTQNKYVSNTVKTHLDKMVGSNSFELDIGVELDKNNNVCSWIKADMVNFNIKYETNDGKIKNYKPDFIIHLTNGVNLILEGKGEERQNVKYKTKATKEWVKSINDANKYGVWEYKIVWKDESNNRWLLELQHILSDSYKIRHVCIKCNRKETDAKTTSDLFKVTNDDGILKYDKVCKNCRSKSGFT